MKERIPYGEEKTDFSNSWNVPSAAPKNEDDRPKRRNARGRRKRS